MPRMRCLITCQRADRSLVQGPNGIWASSTGEHWRPYSPSILDLTAEQLLPEQFKDEFMCLSYPVSRNWQEQYPVTVCRDGKMRAQIVRKQLNLDFHKLLSAFHGLTRHDLLLNAGFSRPGERLVCTPEVALNMFLGTDLNYMIMEDVLVTKRESSLKW